MKILLVILALILLAGVTAWLRSARAASAESAFTVTFSDSEITVTAPDGERKSVAWNALTKVGIRTTDDGPMQADVFWGLHAGAGEPAIVFPGGATGETALLEALQRRLPGFRNEELIQAMGSTSNAYFTLWTAPQASSTSESP